MPTDSSAWPEGMAGVVSLSFDDGSGDQLDIAVPVLNEFGLHGTPALYEAPRGRVSRALFAEACAAEGLYVGGGYTNWYRTPVFQDTKLMSQLWTVEHPNGVTYTPLGEGALPNDESIRQRLLVFPIPPFPAPEFMTQVAQTVEKVAANMASLARFGAKRKSKGIPGA